MEWKNIHKVQKGHLLKKCLIKSFLWLTLVIQGRRIKVRTMDSMKRNGFLTSKNLNNKNQRKIFIRNPLKKILRKNLNIKRINNSSKLVRNHKKLINLKNNLKNNQLRVIFSFLIIIKADKWFWIILKLQLRKYLKIIFGILLQLIKIFLLVCLYYYSVGSKSQFKFQILEL